MYKVIDLTHTLDPSIPTWSGSCGYHQELKLDYDECDSAVKFRVQKLTMHAGIGTHIDSPAHCIKGGVCVDSLDLHQLIAPCVCIHVHEAGANYTFKPEDLYTFEKAHGKIAPQSFVIIHTGWDQHWKEPEKYRNNHLFPSISKEAAQLLLDRDITGIGIDTLSPDTPSSGYPVHQLLLSAGKYIVENIANASLLPPTGSTTFALPLKAKGATESPIRLIALVLRQE